MPPIGQAATSNRPASISRGGRNSRINPSASGGSRINGAINPETIVNGVRHSRAKSVVVRLDPTTARTRNVIAGTAIWMRMINGSYGFYLGHVTSLLLASPTPVPYSRLLSKME